MRPLLPIALLLLAVSAGMSPAQEPRQIAVTGTADVEVVPDTATVTAGVEAEATTAAEALEAAAAQMQAVFAALDAAAIAPADIQTSSIGLGPVYAGRPGEDGAPPMTVGYRATNLVTVRVRDVGRLGAVIDALGPVANRLQDISFDVAEPGPHLDEARRMAVADARARAELLAGAAGVTLGPVLSIREGFSGGGPVQFRAQAEAAMAMPIAEGTLALGASVEIVYGIE